MFIIQSYLSVAKDVRLNSTDYLIMKINNKRELQNIATNHSAYIDYKNSMKNLTVADQLKIINDKVKANQAQYDLDRLAAIIFFNYFI